MKRREAREDSYRPGPCSSDKFGAGHSAQGSASFINFEAKVRHEGGETSEQR